MNKRSISEKEFIHENLGSEFEKGLSTYDTQRRVEVLVFEFLNDDLSGKKILDVGCGLGFFSKALIDRGAEVTSFDLGKNLVAKTVKLCGSKGVVGDVLSIEQYFKENEFDIVVSSECIEHTPNPTIAIEKMIYVLKKDGILSLSTPNLLWWPVVKLATVLKLRPFSGLENFSTWKSLEKVLSQNNMQLELKKGLHLFPFQFRMFKLSRFFDKHFQCLSFLMINLCIKAKKIK